MQDKIFEAIQDLKEMFGQHICVLENRITKLEDKFKEPPDIEQLVTKLVEKALLAKVDGRYILDKQKVDKELYRNGLNRADLKRCDRLEASGNRTTMTVRQPDGKPKRAIVIRVEVE